MRILVLLAGGLLVNSLGTGMTAFALGVHVYGLTGSASAVALVQLCAFAPIILLAPVAGVLADRHDRRIMMVLGDGGSVLGLAVVVLALAHGAGLAVLCAGVALASCLAALTEPALRATVTDVVEEADYVRASGVVQLASAARFLLAPALAGILLGTIGVTGIVVIDAATCLVTVATSLVARRLIGPVPPVPVRAGLGARLAEGWRAVVGADGVLAVVGLMTLVCFAMGAVQALLKPILLPLGDARAVGLCEALAAAGLVAGAALVSARPGQAPVRLLVLGLAAAGAAMVLLGLRPSLVWVGAMGALLFLALPATNAGADALVRAQVTGDVQARAWGLISLLTQAGTLLALVVVGPLADDVLGPLLARDGALAPTLGAVTGTGPGRGAAVLVSFLGLGVIGVAALTHHARHRLAPAPPAGPPRDGGGRPAVEPVPAGSAPDGARP